MLGLMVMVSLSMGYLSISLSDMITVIGHRLLHGSLPDIPLADTYGAVIFDVRLPRILTCAAVGAALSVSGVLFQGILLNPLADPYTLGVSAGAAFGASMAILLNLTATHVSVPLFAFIGACATLFLCCFYPGPPGSGQGALLQQPDSVRYYRGCHPLRRHQFSQIYRQ